MISMNIYNMFTPGLLFTIGLFNSHTSAIIAWIEDAFCKTDPHFNYF